MVTKLCSDCGTVLTAWNHNFGSSRCADCVRVPLSRSKSFFDRTKPAEGDIQNYPLSKVTQRLAGYTIFLFVCITLGGVIGYGNARSFGGLAYGFLGGMAATLIYRWLVGMDPVNPLDAKRWYNFALVYTLVTVLVWVMAYMGFMPSINFPMGGSLFSFHVLVAPSISVPAFTLVTLIGLLAGVAGAVLGYLNLIRLDNKNKAHSLSHYQRWKGTAS
jgi:hypothetical protein